MSVFDKWYWELFLVFVDILTCRWGEPMFYFMTLFFFTNIFCEYSLPLKDHIWYSDTSKNYLPKLDTFFISHCAQFQQRNHKSLYLIPYNHFNSKYLLNTNDWVLDCSSNFKNTYVQFKKKWAYVATWCKSTVLSF